MAKEENHQIFINTQKMCVQTWSQNEDGDVVDENKLQSRIIEFDKCPF